jgi:hypothetical protein
MTMFAGNLIAAAILATFVLIAIACWQKRKGIP